MGEVNTPPAQEIRDLVATMKLIPVKEVIAGNRIVLCEDSIVRGTQLKNFTLKKLWEAGAKEVHVRPACPPLMFPCKFALSTRSLTNWQQRRAIRALEGFDKRGREANTSMTDQKNMQKWLTGLHGRYKQQPYNTCG